LRSLQTSHTLATTPPYRHASMEANNKNEHNTNAPLPSAFKVHDKMYISADKRHLVAL
ncbi:unnamed protein product, partial [Ceratitis capitata]